ncbi:dTDP-glucose 4,6-dehydratase 2 [Rickettsiales bacterium Ac37b]|nr:dTDP-glucose 4,6-dehydratase 2 [Rickettsiales bacterium Ac37b]
MTDTKKILITGGAGFIGSNFIHYFLNKYPTYQVINLDKLTYAGNLANLDNIPSSANYVFIKGDICNSDLLNKIFSEYSINSVINFAAESHVDNSIKNPKEFITTNVLGTFTLLNIAKTFWQDKMIKNASDCRFHHISTDEVYGTLGDTGYFTEETPYAPNSPYSASKAASDMIARSYIHTYDMNITISNCSNNYGPRQHYEKLIPTIINNALQNRPIPIYGSGMNIRDWLYVDDHCHAIDLIFHQGKKGDMYNIGGNNEQNNLQLAKLLCTLLDKIHPKKNNESYQNQIHFVSDRAGHDYRYAIDYSKLKRELNWHPSQDFDANLTKTIKYYLEKF